MGVKRVIVAALFCALLLGASPSPAQAASGLVRIEMGNCYNVDTDQWDQTWSSSGAFTDQGRWTERLLSTTTINGLTRARLRTVLHSSRGDDRYSLVPMARDARNRRPLVPRRMVCKLGHRRVHRHQREWAVLAHRLPIQRLRLLDIPGQHQQHVTRSLAGVRWCMRCASCNSGDQRVGHESPRVASLPTRRHVQCVACGRWWTVTSGWPAGSVRRPAA
jgi:hypothetical protein